MKRLPLIVAMLVVSGLCSVSCRSAKLGGHAAGPAYELSSPEFVEHTPPQFHQLKLGLSEEAVVEIVGGPGDVRSLWPLGQMGSAAVGKRYTYTLAEGGVVWVDFDADSHVTGIFWRDRD